MNFFIYNSSKFITPKPVRSQSLIARDTADNSGES